MKEVIYLACCLLIVLAQAIFLSYVYWKYQRSRVFIENEFYTDYTRGTLILRVYKHECEFQAIGDVSSYEILDAGNMSPLYKWALLRRK